MDTRNHPGNLLIAHVQEQGQAQVPPGDRFAHRKVAFAVTQMAVGRQGCTGLG